MIRYRIMQLEGEDPYCLVRVRPGLIVRLPLSNAPKGDVEKFHSWLRDVFRKIRQKVRAARKRNRRVMRRPIDEALINSINQDVDIPE